MPTHNARLLTGSLLSSLNVSAGVEVTEWPSDTPIDGDCRCATYYRATVPSGVSRFTLHAQSGSGTSTMRFHPPDGETLNRRGTLTAVVSLTSRPGGRNEFILDVTQGSRRENYRFLVIRADSPPRLVSAHVALRTPGELSQSIYLGFDKSLRPDGPDPGNPQAPPTSAFSVNVYGQAVPLARTEIWQNILKLDIPAVLNHRDRGVTVSYDPPSSNPVQTSQGGLAAAFTDYPVANRLPPVGPGTGGQDGRELLYALMTVGRDSAESRSGYHDGRGGATAIGSLNYRTGYSVRALTLNDSRVLALVLGRRLTADDAARFDLYVADVEYRFADADTHVAEGGRTSVTWNNTPQQPWRTGDPVQVVLVDANKPPLFWGPDPAWDSFFEGSAARLRPFNVGDGDDATLRYALEGRDAALFDIDAATGWISTKPGVVYDYESEERSCEQITPCYQLVVRATDAVGASATGNVRIRLLDVEERAVQNLRVWAPAGTSRELRLSWNAAGADERPTHWEVDWNTADADSRRWFGKTVAGDGTGTRLGSLNANTWYRVRVRPYFGPADLRGRAELRPEEVGEWSPVIYKGTGSANAPALFVDDAEAREGSDTHLVFRVTLRPASASRVTVEYDTSDGSATAPADYTETDGTLTFQPGETRQSVRVPIVDDTTEDFYESLGLTLSNPSGATLADAVARGVIRNTEAEVGVRVAAVTSGPGGNGTWDAGETVEAELRFNAPVTVTGGPPTLAVLLDGTRREAAYAGGSGTNTLTFRHTVTASDAGAKRARVAANGVSTNGASMLDGEGREVELRFPVAPWITAVELAPDASGDRRWSPGETIEARLTFNEEMTVAGGSPWLELRIGGFAQPALLAYASGSGSRTLAFSTEVPEGATPFTGLAVVADSLAANGASVLSAMSRLAADLRHDGTEPSAAPEAATDNPLTAEFLDVPASHGNARFEVRLRFGEDLKLSYLTLRDEALRVTNGTVSGVRRTTQGKDREWYVVVTPDRRANKVTVTLPARACVEAGAVCTADDRGLAADVTATVPRTAQRTSPGDTPFKVELRNAPEEHDGSSEIVFEVAFNKRPNGGYSYTHFRDSAFRINRGGTRLTPGLGRLNGRHNDRWRVSVSPGGKEDVTVRIGPFSLCSDAGAVCTFSGEVLANEVEKTIQGPPGLSVADARVEENSGDPVAFAVTLGRESVSTVTVDYATSDGTAEAGLDYTETSGTLTFAPGETAQTVSVAVLDDDHDEGDETFTLTLSNPTGGNAWLADATATGTIENSDPMPRAWLARFGRTVVDQVLDAVGARMWGGSGGRSHVVLGGHEVARAAPTPDEGEAPPALLQAAAREGANNSPAPTLSELFVGSSLQLATAAGGAEDVPRWTLWARGARSSFKGVEGNLTLEGDVTTGLAGADYESGGMLAGVTVTLSAGEGAYVSAAASGAVETRLVGVYPYVRYAASELLSAWGVVGMGAGELKLDTEQGEKLETDISLAMAAAGARGALLAGSGYELAVKSDFSVVRTESEQAKGLAASEAHTRRLRLLLDGSGEVGLGGGTLTPSVEAGLRYDGGDAETGLGLEVGGGLRYAISVLALEVRARALIVHEQQDYEEWGVSGSVVLAPGAGGRGLSLRAGSAVGVAAGDTERIWSSAAADLARGGSFAPRARVEAEVGYGVDALGGLLTPYGGITVHGDGAGSLHVGGRLVLGEGFSLSLEGDRTEGEGDPVHGVQLTGSLHW